MRGFDIAGDFGGQLRKELANDVVAEKSLAILRFEELFENHAFQRLKSLLVSELVAPRKDLRLLALGQTVGRDGLNGDNMNRIAVERSVNCNALSFHAQGLVLRIELIHLGDVVVVEHQRGAGEPLLRALAQTGERVRIAGAVHDHPGPLFPIATAESDACLVAVAVFKTVAPTQRAGG